MSYLDKTNYFCTGITCNEKKVYYQNSLKINELNIHLKQNIRRIKNKTLYIAKLNKFFLTNVLKVNVFGLV